MILDRMHHYNPHYRFNSPTCPLTHHLTLCEHIFCLVLGLVPMHGFWPVHCGLLSRWALSSLQPPCTFALVFPTLHLGQPTCFCRAPLESKGVHILQCGHASERTMTHDDICDVVVVIAWDFGYHVTMEQRHVLPPHDGVLDSGRVLI